MVFVAVGEQDGPHLFPVTFEKGKVRGHRVHAKVSDFREHQTGVNHDDVCAVAQHHAVHAELAESAQGDDFQCGIVCIAHAACLAPTGGRPAMNGW